MTARMRLPVLIVAAAAMDATAEHALDELRGVVTHVYTDGSPEYDETITMGGVLGQRSSPPQVVARPLNQEEVEGAMKWADHHGFRVSVKSAGTQPGGFALLGDLLLDMKNLRTVTVDDGVVLIQGGATWADVYNATDQAGLNVNGGRLEDSVAGSILSGGIGIWGYKHGLISDGVMHANVVMPNGEVVHATHSKHPRGGLPAPAEALYNLRGGFPLGVITKIELQAQPVHKTFVAGKLHCTFAPSANMSAVMGPLLPAIAHMNAGVHVKVASAGGTLWMHFLADAARDLAPMLKIPELQKACYLIDLRGEPAPLGDLSVTLAGDERFRTDLVSNVQRAIESVGKHKSFFHGDSRGVLTRMPHQAAPHLAAVLQKSAHVAQFISINVWPVRASEQDDVGHAFPHASANLLITVRCTVAGMCPMLWMELEPITTGLYLHDESTTLPGDASRIFGPSYRAAKCLQMALSPSGADLVQSPLPPDSTRIFTNLAAEASSRLSCPMPFLRFSPCDTPHGGAVLVTGVDGLGLEASRLLAQQGLQVVLAASNGVECLEGAQKVYLDTGLMPTCRIVDLTSQRSVERFARNLPMKLDAAIFAADAVPDKVQYEVAHRPDRAVRMAAGNLYLATQLIEQNRLLPHGRIVFSSLRMGFDRADPSLLDIFTATHDYGETLASAQVITAFGASALQQLFPHVGVGLSVVPNVRTPVIAGALESGNLEPSLMKELSAAPSDDAALLAAGSSLVRALVPGSFCYDGCGKLECSLPPEGVCSAWENVRTYVPVPSIGTCASSVRVSFVLRSVEQGLAGMVAMALNILVMLPIYNLLSVHLHSGMKLDVNLVTGLTSSQRGCAQLYNGLKGALLLSPLLRFGDTFAHGLAAEIFGISTIPGIAASACLTAAVYALWRVLVCMIFAPEQLGMPATRLGKQLEELSSQKPRSLWPTISATFLSSLPFWFTLDAVLLVTSVYARSHISDIVTFELMAYLLGGAMAGFASCLAAVSGSGLLVRLPICALEGALFVFAWKCIMP